MDKELLAEYGKGIIALSGCPSGEMHKLLNEGREDEAPPSDDAVAAGPADACEQPEDRPEDDEREQDVQALRERVEEVPHDRAEDDLREDQIGRAHV